VFLIYNGISKKCPAFGANAVIGIKRIKQGIPAAPAAGREKIFPEIIKRLSKTHLHIMRGYGICFGLQES
jgi:hypothetical protein